MPILTHCPNPVCGKAHQVKDKYAGARGRCPACSHWMFVPNPPPAPARIPPSPPPFGTQASVLLVLGIVGLAIAACAPYFQQPAFAANGDHASIASTIKVEGVKSELGQWASAVPLLAAVPAFLALLVGGLFRRTNGLSILFTYVSILAASALAFTALCTLKAEHSAIAGLRDWLASSSRSGEAMFSMGYYVQAAAIGTVSAAALFLLAAFCLHRKVWARVVSFAALGLPLAAGAMWLYRVELARMGLFPGVTL